MITGMPILEKPVGYYKQSGVIPYRYTNGKMEILLITSRKKKKWVIPKGIIESGMSPEESASKEAFEEAGIKGVVYDRNLGEYSYEKWGGLCRVKVYPMKVEEILDKWEEDDFRERKWFSPDKALDKIKDDSLREIVKIFPSVLGS